MKQARKISRKEKSERLITNWAFGILFALCIQFLVYIVILNLVPTFVKTTNPTDIDIVNAQLNSIEYEEENVPVVNSFYITDNYYTTNGNFKTSVENPTMFIYYYNMFILVATILLILYYFVDFMEKNDGKIIQKIKAFLKKQWPFAILLVFMIWVFISSLLARDTYRSFIGCFNLKDGYLSFMTYGSVLICSMLLMKKNEKYKKTIVNTFLITATILAIITLWNYYYLNSDKFEYHAWGTVYQDALDDGTISQSEIDVNYFVTYGEDPSKTVFTLAELIFGNGGLPRGKNFLIVTKRVLSETNSGIFHNSNHYGYYLSICVIVAAAMFMKEKKTSKSLLYMIAYIIMLKMAILNNTFGAYLGIGASIVFMLIYALIPKNSKINKKELGATAIIIAIFTILSLTTYSATNGKNIVKNNFTKIFEDLNTLVGSKTTQTIDVISGDMEESVSGNSETNIVETSNNDDASDIGSGRGILWLKAFEMALQKPLFGYGLENILYEYNEQFGISEGRSHNLVLQLSATTGIIGMLLYVCGIAAIWIRKLKYIKTWDMYECIGMFVIVSYIISSLVGNSGFYTSGYFYIFVGFVALKADDREKEVISKNKK